MTPKQSSDLAVVLAAGSNGLSALRGLTAAGVPTIVIAEAPDEPALARETILAAGDEAVLGALEGIAGEGHAVIPTSDRFVELLARHRGRLAPRLALAVPSDEAIAAFIDKEAETRLVGELGVPLPRTLAPLPDDPEALLAALSLPVIVKPRSYAQRNVLGHKNAVLATEEEVRTLWGRIGVRASALLAQEIVPGGDDTLWVCNCTFDRAHGLVGAFTIQRLGMSSAHPGVTTYARSARTDEVVDLTERLGLAARSVGPAMVEFKWDARDRRYKYIELNPRLGMCNYFDTTCGVNNALLAYEVVRGSTPPRQMEQRDGEMYLSPREDLPNRLSVGESLAGALIRYLRNGSRAHVWPIFSARDPGPALNELGRSMRGAVRWSGRALLASVMA